MRRTFLRTARSILTAAALGAALVVGQNPADAATTALSPPGANDWSCRPTSEHPHPVVLVHGTFENRFDNWGTMSPSLKASGYCVFALNYGSHDPTLTINGTDDIPTSARQLSNFVDKVLDSSGASKVDIIGHSQGGMMPRYYIKFLEGASKVGELIGLAPSNHGTTVDGLTNLLTRIPGAGDFAGQCVACRQQYVGSDFLSKLNDGAETDPAVHYHVIETTHDEVVTPYTSAFLAPASNVTNVKLQSLCALDPSEHVAIAWDPIAIRAVKHYLDPSVRMPSGCLMRSASAA